MDVFPKAYVYWFLGSGEIVIRPAQHRKHRFWRRRWAHKSGQNITSPSRNVGRRFREPAQSISVASLGVSPIILALRHHLGVRIGTYYKCYLIQNATILNNKNDPFCLSQGSIRWYSAIWGPRRRWQQRFQFGAMSLPFFRKKIFRIRYFSGLKWRILVIFYQALRILSSSCGVLSGVSYFLSGTLFTLLNLLKMHWLFNQMSWCSGTYLADFRPAPSLFSSTRSWVLRGSTQDSLRHGRR